jgi:hypothetical protein
MGRPHPTNDSGCTNYIRPPLLGAILLILLGPTTTLATHCTTHHPTMAIYKQSDAAAAAKTSAKVSMHKPRTLTATQHISQRSLHTRQSSGSPKENDTNSHIATINLNRDRFDNVLTTLGGKSPGKNITPPESPTGLLDKPQDLLLPPTLDYDEPTDDTSQKLSGSMVRIKDTPTSVAPAASPQAEHENTPPLTRRRYATRIPTAPNPTKQQDNPATATTREPATRSYQQAGRWSHT